MLFALEQALLACLALTIWNCVVSNALSIDQHYRAGLGVTLLGLVYITGHSVYLAALKPAAPKHAAEPKITVGFATREHVKPEPEKEKETARPQQESDAPSIRVELGSGTTTEGYSPFRSGVEIRSAVNESVEVGGYTSVPAAAPATSQAPGTVMFRPGVIARPARLTVAAGAYSGASFAPASDFIPAVEQRSFGSETPGEHPGPSPRALSDAQVRRAISLLKTKPKQVVMIVTIAGEGDGPRVADQLIDLFADAGWSVFAQASEARTINGNDVGQGIRFMAPDRDHEAVRIAADAFRDTPLRPVSILPVSWSTSPVRSPQDRTGQPLTIVIGIPQADSAYAVTLSASAALPPPERATRLRGDLRRTTPRPAAPARRIRNAEAIPAATAASPAMIAGTACSAASRCRRGP